MPIDERFRRQVALLLRSIPAIAREKCFALKGGTAINLFIRDLPRLSVDIDLTYVPVAPRNKSLAAIDKALRRIEARIVKSSVDLRVSQSHHDECVTKLVVREGRSQIKIEVTPVLRGCVFEPELRSVSSAVEAEFGFAEMPVVSLADLYAGKLVAALDRQHPRDLFDVKELLAHEGLTPEIRSAFLVYLVSHNRPMAEVLAARPKDITREFETNFTGMTTAPVELADLLRARDDMVATLIRNMPKAHRKFLLSFEQGKPDWALVGLDGAGRLPAVQWRQQNLDALSAGKRANLVSALAKVLDLEDQAPKPNAPAPSKKRRRSPTP